MHLACCVCRNARQSTSTMISNTNGAGADCMCMYNMCYILCLCGINCNCCINPVCTLGAPPAAVGAVSAVYQGVCRRVLCLLSISAPAPTASFFVHCLCIAAQNTCAWRYASATPSPTLPRCVSHTAPAQSAWPVPM